MRLQPAGRPVSRPTPGKPAARGSPTRPDVGAGTRGPAPAGGGAAAQAQSPREVVDAAARPVRVSCRVRCWSRLVSPTVYAALAPCGGTGLGEATLPAFLGHGAQAVTEGHVRSGGAGRVSGRPRERGGGTGRGPPHLDLGSAATQQPSSRPSMFSLAAHFLCRNLGCFC